MYCIYKYTSPSGKSYIGQTKTSLAVRAGGVNGQNYIKCPLFYKAILKYGFQNLHLVVLEDGLTKLEADNREEYYIKKHKTLTPNGYNLSSGGESQPDQSKPVNKYNQRGELVAQYSSMTEAAIENKCSVGSISEVCSGRKNTLLAHYWSYSDQIPVFKTGKHKRVYQFDEEGYLIMEFESAVGSDRYNNFVPGTTKQCANKNQQRKRINGYIFTYEPFIDWEYYTLKHNSTTISGESTPKRAEALCSTKVDEDIV